MVQLVQSDIKTTKVLDWQGIHLFHFAASSCAMKMTCTWIWSAQLVLSDVSVLSGMPVQRLGPEHKAIGNPVKGRALRFE